MMAIILAGGKGTRLKPFTVTIPKPLLPVGDTPILEIVIRQLASHGFTRVVLSLGHMAPFFTPFFSQWEQFGVSIECSIEDEPLGTAAPLALVKDIEENFLVMNGDLLTTLNYGALVDEHIARKASGTIAVNRRELKVDYGVVSATPEGLLNEYSEKPVLHYDVSMGINVLARECLQYIPSGKKFDMPELMLAMQRAGKTVLCHKTDCYWLDMGRFDDYQQASADFAEHPERFLPGEA
jgi:NDP-sugar pyrophosphorylase family protein